MVWDIWKDAVCGEGVGGGRAAVVVPNGTLFADGIAARVKEQMLKKYNLHTVVRLPYGVFEPYTSIPANILFFSSKSGFGEIYGLKDVESQESVTHKSSN